MSNCVGSSGLGLPASAVALLSRHTRRREVIALLSGVASWPFDARAQQSGSTRRIGVLMGYIESHPVGQSFVAAFREELQKLGWVEGRNIQIHTRWTAGDDVGARQRSAKELVAQQPDLILAQNTPVTAALLRETRTIPIVFATVSDPVGSGFVASMPRPGGNATGFTNIEASTAGKWLELLKEIAPHVSRAAFLFNPATASYADYLSAFKSSALSFAIEAIAAPVHSTSELEPVFSALAREPNGGLVAMTDTFLTNHHVQITSLAAHYHIPAVYPYRLFTEVGGLLSYGNDTRDNFRRAAAYVDRILKGTKPSELAVQATVKFELVINLKSAKALGLEVPLHLQQRADEVIE